MEDIWNLSRSLNIYVCKEANRTADYLAKKGLSRFDSSVCCWSNFPKDDTNISFHDYCGFLSNCVCKFSVQ